MMLLLKTKTTNRNLKISPVMRWFDVKVPITIIHQEHTLGLIWSSGCLVTPTGNITMGKIEGIRPIGEMHCLAQKKVAAWF